MWKKILTMCLVLVVVLSLTACAKEPSPPEIVHGVIHSMDEIRTHEYDINWTIDRTLEVEGQASVHTLAISINCALDVENRQWRMDGTMESTPKTVQPDITGRTEMYIIDGMAYSKLTEPGEESRWTKEEAPDGWLEEWQQSHQNGIGWVEWYGIEILKGAQVQVIGSENVGGIDCYVLEVTPGLQQLWQLHSHLLFQEASEVTEEYLQEVFRSFSIKHWVAKDTYFLIKSEMDIHTEFPEMQPLSTIDIAMVLLCYNYNQPVTIVLPPEAEEAIEMPIE
jgi:hypothetical protein